MEGHGSFSHLRGVSALEVLGDGADDLALLLGHSQVRHQVGDLLSKVRKVVPAALHVDCHDHLREERDQE